MRYVSTRGRSTPRDFAGVLLAGLADDEGLFVPETWPVLDAAAWRSLRGLPYPALATRIIGLFAAGSIDEATVARIVEAACRAFAHPAVAPLSQLDHDLWSLELFHGPTLAFKDVAMQVLGGLFAHVLEREGRRATIVGATSGDTGSAAIEAFRDRDAVDIVILHPRGRTSEVQRRQMTTVLSPNVANLAVEGHFDDCQALLKAMFADAPFRDAVGLSAVNSINWARIAAQIPYYAAAALALGAPDRAIDVAVPTGNFGNVLAAWAARRMGLPIRRLVLGSNRNDILARFVARNDMRVAAVHPTLSPSMDIQVSSNFERLLFELLGRDGDALSRVMAAFRETGAMPVPDAAWREAAGVFRAHAVDDEATVAAMRRLWEGGVLADPHSAIGIEAGRRHREPGVPMVVASTAHPAKFPDAVRRATGVTPPLPRHLEDLATRPERFRTVPNDLAAVEGAVRAHLTRHDAAAFPSPSAPPFAE